MTVAPIQVVTDAELKAWVETTAEADGLKASGWVRELIKRERVRRDGAPKPPFDTLMAQALSQETWEADELPDPPRLCERCQEPLPASAHHLRKYHEECTATKAKTSEPQECKICTKPDAKNGNEICAHCHGLRHNTVYLFRMYVTHRLERTRDGMRMTGPDVTDRFKRWVLDDLNLQPTFDKLYRKPGSSSLLSLLVPDADEAIKKYRVSGVSAPGGAAVYEVRVKR